MPDLSSIMENEDLSGFGLDGAPGGGIQDEENIGNILKELGHPEAAVKQTKTIRVKNKGKGGFMLDPYKTMICESYGSMNRERKKTVDQMILNFLKESGELTDKEKTMSDEELLRLHRPNKGYNYVLAVEKSKRKLVGFRAFNPNLARTCHTAMSYVNANLRRKGISTQMFVGMKEYLIENYPDITILLSETRVDNTSAIQMLEQWNFKGTRSGTLINYAYELRQ